MKRSPWPFKVRTPAEREADKEQRRQELLAATLRPLRQGVMAGGTTAATPKRPADRNQRLRDLAQGEACCVLLPACRRDHEHTVWGHTNTLGDEKGKGYKAHDSQGFFTCDRCHHEIDQGTALSREERAAAVMLAQARTDVRLIEIANSPTMRPWKIETARWALERRGIGLD